MKVHFRLSRPAHEEPTAIKLDFYYKKNHYYGTGIKIHPRHWDFEIQRAITGSRILSSDKKKNPFLRNELKQINGRLNQVEVFINNYLQERRVLKKQFDIEELKSSLEQITKPQIKEITNKPTAKDNTFVAIYIDQYIIEMINGDRTTDNGTRYAEGTIKNYKQFQSFWKGFELVTKTKYRFDDIDGHLYSSLTKFCNEKMYRHNYTGRIIKQLKTLMRASYREGIHNNDISKITSFKVLRTSTEAVYLTRKELDSLYSLDLSVEPILDTTRDVFLIGCYTGLRYSDAKRIRPEHVIHDESSNLYTLEITTKKTGGKVFIPIRPELLSILKKYEFTVPKTYEQKINSRIKEIAKRAGIIDRKEINEIIAGRKISKNVPKYQLITTHTGRRTAATLMYLDGIPTIDIMKITGHRQESTFLKYIKISNRQNADRLRNSRFFSGSDMKVI